MIPTIVLGIVIAIAVIVYLNMHGGGDKNQRTNYLRQLAKFFDSEVMPIPDAENSFRISFRYRERDWIYEDIEVSTGRGVEHVGTFKLLIPTKLKLSFTERSRTQIRSNVKSLEDVATSMWGTDAPQVKLPKPLQDFQTHTNNPGVANKLVNDDKVLKILLAYNNRDTRGHPVMSIHIHEGVISLEFHPNPNLKPSILELQHNVTEAEKYLQELKQIGDALQNLEAEK